MNYKDKFIERTKHHIELVNKYAHKIGHIYSYHDCDKLGQLLDAYSLSFKYDGFYNGGERKGMNPDEYKAYNDATIKHITSNPHHPEFFLNRLDKERLVNNFTRDNPVYNLDCTKMTDQAIIEMCCDWCAMSEEFGNAPLEWMQRTCGILDLDDNCRWLFTVDQIWLIVDTLNKLWDENENFYK